MRIGDLVYTYSLVEDEIYKGRVSKIHKDGLFSIDNSSLEFDNDFTSYLTALEYRDSQIHNRTLKMKLKKLFRTIKKPDIIYNVD